MSEYLPGGVRAVFFDHDDTLVGTIGPKWAQHKHVARTYYGRELTDADIKQHWGKPLGELMCLLYGTDDVETALANNWAHHLEYPKTLHGATIPTLRHLKAAGFIIGVVTATIRESLEHDLTQLEMPRELFDYTQTADDTAFHKPDPRVFEPTLRWLADQNIQPSEVLYVGDGLHDAAAALGAGFSFIGVETGLITTEEFKLAGIQSIPHVGRLVRGDESVSNT